MARMKWGVEFHPEALEEIDALDPSVRKQILAAIKNKLETDPKGYGDPLGSKAGIILAGLYSMRVANRKIRVIYFVHDRMIEVLVMAVARRERFEAHRMAEDRIKRLKELTAAEFKKLKSIADGATTG